MEKLDLNQVMETNFLGDWDLFVTVAEAFKQSIPVSMGHLQNAIRDGDNKKVKDYAHKLVGSIAHFHHVDPVKTARKLEEGWQTLTSQEMQAAFADLEKQVDLLQEDLSRLATERKVA